MDYKDKAITTRQDDAGTVSRSGSGRLHRTTSPVAMIHHAAAIDDGCPLVTKVTLRLLDEDGIPSGYLSGAALNEAMLQVYDAVLGPIHSQRLQRFEAITDWRLGPGLVDTLAVAVIDPLADALRSDRARVVSLCYLALTRGGVDVPSDIWWTPVVWRELKAANPAEQLTGGQSLLAAANHSTYHFVTNLKRCLLPARQVSEADQIRHSLLRVFRSCLLGLLDHVES